MAQINQLFADDWRYMVFYLGMIFIGFGNIIFIVGGLLAGSAFFYGVYLALFKSVANGLMVIGASVVITIAIRILAPIFIGIGTSICHKSANDDLKSSN